MATSEAATSDEVLVATRSAVVRRDGQRIVVKEGISRAAAGSWIARAYPDMWEAASTGVDFGVEQATAAPGEKRSKRKGKTKTTKTDDKGGSDDVECPVDGCDYSGTERGLKIHTGQQHA